MRRVEVEGALLNHRGWLLNTYASLPQQVLETPVTRDGHDPALWWTVKDHFAHCTMLPLEAVRRLRRALGETVDEDELEVNLTTTSVDQIGAAVNRFTHRLFLRHRDTTIPELVVLGERVLCDQLAVLSCMEDGHLDDPLPGEPAVYGTRSQMLLGPLLHDPIHWNWVMEALVRQAHGNERRAVLEPQGAK